MITVHPGLDELMTDIADVRQHPENARNGDVDAIAESIEINGLYRPVYAQRSSGMILAGNHTYAALLSLGADRIPVIWLDVDDATARRILLVDNRSADLGMYDDAALLRLLDEVMSTDSLLGTGYDAKAYEDLRRLNEAEARRAIGVAGVSYVLVITCVGEEQQAALLSELTERGLAVRAGIV